MIQRILATALNALGAVFPEFRARPAHANACQNTCHTFYLSCLNGCGSDLNCKALCTSDYNDCLNNCRP